MSTVISSGRRPIGFWLELIDGLIDQSFERVLDARG